MVDLKLEALDLAEASKDLYVAVRVGETQKLSRLAASRNYKFNQAAIGDRKFARVDVFRRVGSTSVSIKNAETTSTMEEVSVRIPEQNPLKMRIHLSPESQEKRKAQVAKLGDAEKNEKVLEAKHYLLEHNLEDRLSQAMQGVLRDRPQDPGQYIADLLRKTAKDYQPLPPPTPSSSRPAAWSQKPSIATWLSIPTTGLSPTTPSSSPPAVWSQKPSIATWLSIPTRPAAAPQTRPVLELRTEANEAMLKSAQDGSLQKILEETLKRGAKSESKPDGLQTKAAALRQEAKETILKASADGSLEGALQDAIASVRATNSWTGKPSVGTWLVPRYKKEEVKKEPERVNLTMIPLQCVYGPGFASTGIRPNFVFR